jgi:hypothetical protein
MSCKTAYFDGLGSCKKLFPKINGVVLLKKGTSFTEAQLEDIATWETAIASTTDASRTAKFIPVMSFENRTDEPTENTTPLGKTYKDGDPIPKGTTYVDAGFMDYKAMLAYDGAEFDVYFLLQNGGQFCTLNSSGEYKGFTATLGVRKGLPMEDRLQNYPLMMYFDNVDEFEEAVVISPDYSTNDIKELTPAGLDIKLVTAYTGGDVVVKVVTRGTGEGFTGLAVGDFDVKDSNATPTVAVTVASDDGLGQYTLTVKKDNDGTPANLASTDWVIIQCGDESGSLMTHLSSSFRFKGGA